MTRTTSLDPDDAPIGGASRELDSRVAGGLIIAALVPAVFGLALLVSAAVRRPLLTRVVATPEGPAARLTASLCWRSRPVSSPAPSRGSDRSRARRVSPPASDSLWPPRRSCSARARRISVDSPRRRTLCSLDRA